jgi:hypothetical protein
MVESIAEYHRRRAAEELAEAALHADDITAEKHRQLAMDHLALASEAERCSTAIEQGRHTIGKRPTGGFEV